MKIFDIISMCFQNLWRRKARTFLTVIGVIIGCCAIIVMISLGLGMNAAMDEMLKNWGDLNAVTIYGNGGYYGGGNSSSEPTPLDDAALETLRNLDHVEIAFPKFELNSEMLTIAAGKKNRYICSWPEVYGVDFSLLSKMGYEIDEGEWPDEGDKAVMVMGYEMPYRFRDTRKRDGGYVWRETMPDGTVRKPWINPMEEDILLYVNDSSKQDEKTWQYLSGGRGYEHKMRTSCILKQDVDWETPYSIMIDIDFAKQLYEDYNRLNKVKDAKDPQYSMIKLWVDDINNVDEVQSMVEALGFNASSMAQVRKEMQGQLMIIQVVLGGLAAISLLVAAIGIANTMIMSIYERTREIGIMKVLGCFVGNIRALFLMEAGMIGLLGGVIGTIISYIFSFLINKFGANLFANMFGGTAAKVSIIPLWLVLLALIFSCCVGLISGFYPANRAVKISALEAIKNE